MTRPWAPGAATGVGSLPGTDPREAAKLVIGELPDFPHVPELPARGPHAGLVGRGAAALVDLHVDLQPAGWRLVPRPGADERRARSALAEDLDAVEEAAAGHAGPLKAQLAGPWTLAAGLELERGERAVADPGAARDLVSSLAEGVAGHVADLRRRVPLASVIVQVDEPSLPAVLAGRLPTASGYGRLPAVDPAVAETGLAAVLFAATAAGAAATVVHCCAGDVPLDLLRRVGADAVSVDAGLLGPGADEEVGEAVEAGVALFLGVVPAVEAAGPARVAAVSDPAASVGGVRRLWRRLGFPAERLAATVVPTPTCGLAGASPAHARAALAVCRAAGRLLVDDPEGPA